MTMEPMDLSASKYRRMDLTGEACALVKVQLAIANVSFEGNVIQPVEYKGGEYWVYMTKGSRELRIKHQVASPAFLPCHIFFADYGITGLESLATYELLLPMGNTQKLIINYNPPTAMVIVDSKVYRGNGSLEIELPVGEHSYVIAEDGYESAEGSVKLNGGMPRKINVSLESTALSSTTIASVVQATSQTIESHLPPVIQNLINKMVYVEGGKFTMGATREQGNEARDYEKPTHQVFLSSFSIGKYEVTQEEWYAVMGSNPSYFKGAKRPVEMVSWDDCQKFIDKLNTITGKKFRLPTEAEWEFAARGGNKSKGYKYSGSNEIDKVAWYGNNSGGTTHDVGQKSPNELGLYDMSGNAWEWCQDWYDNYGSNSQTDPSGPSSGKYRMNRGGSWYDKSSSYRVSFRNTVRPDHSYHTLGLRLAL